MTDMSILRMTCFLVALHSLCEVTLSFAEISTQAPNLGGNRSGSSIDCARSVSQAVLEINNVRASVMAAGDMWWSVFGEGNASYEIPKQDNPDLPKKHSSFAAGIWLGGKEATSGQLLVIANTYRQSNYSLWNGPVEDKGLNTGNILPAECLAWDRHFTVTREEVEDYILKFQNGQIRSENDIPESILLWPGKNNPYINELIGGGNMDMTQVLAPFVEDLDTSRDGNYDPLLGDYPKILGDQDIWWIMNDVGSDKEFGGVVGGVGAEPAQIQIETQAFAIASNDCMNDATFYMYTLKNKGVKDITELYFGKWMDSDLGSAIDDFVGVDVPRGLAYTYNGDDFDEGLNGYGSHIPAIGIDFFAGPVAILDTIGDGIDNDNDGFVDENDAPINLGYRVYEGDGADNDRDCNLDEPCERLQMSNFLYYNGTPNACCGNPGSATDFFNYLRGIWKDGQFLTHDLRDGTGQSFPRTNFMFPDNSDLEIGWGLGGNCSSPVVDEYNRPWNETIAGNFPGNRRMLGSIGPFNLRPGEIQDLIIGVPWAMARNPANSRIRSLEKLKACDDQIQALFNNAMGCLSDISQFEFLNGPNAPEVAFVENNQEIILSWEPSDFVVWDDGILYEMNTETYFERSPKTNSYFRFQGYRVYQLRKPDVDLRDLDNPDLAREIGVFDLNDDVTSIINYEIDYELGLDRTLPRLKVEGKNGGVKRTLRITEDLFGELNNDLINHKRYHFLVIAYGYNKEEDELNQSQHVLDRNGRPYIESQKNLKIITAVPHIPIGEQINATYGEEFVITTLQGEGNGGRIVELNPGVEEEILRTNSTIKTYKPGFGPVKIKVVNPGNLQEVEKIEISLNSRLVVRKGENGKLFPGDTLISLGEFDYNSVFSGPDGLKGRLNEWIRQSPGVAEVIRELRELETDSTFTVEAKLINGDEAGTFTREAYFFDSLEFAYYKELPTRFTLIGRGFENGWDAIEFRRNDLWTLNTANEIYYAEYPISSEHEETIPAFGISLELSPGIDPGFRSVDPEFNKNNGLLESSLTFLDPGNPWLIPISSQDVDWQNSQKQINPADQGEIYKNVMGGGVGPYIFGKENQSENATSPYVSNGIDQIERYQISNAFQGLNNVDLVFTPGDSRYWTRMPVLQFEAPAEASQPTLFKRSQKSRIPSVDKNGDPDHSKDANGKLSTGYGWFPGYAIDLDRGERVNIVMAESRIEDPIKGNDLLWNPDDSENGSRHFIMLTNRKYDFGPNGEPGKFQTDLDSLFSDPDVMIKDYGIWFSNTFTWSTCFRLNPNSRLGVAKSNARLRLRVQNSYSDQKRGESPVFTFSTMGYGVKRNDPQKLKDHLELVSIVPNPYYAFSQYETGPSDRRAKITNLPPKCEVSIFTLNGSLVRQFQVERPEAFGEIEEISDANGLANGDDGVGSEIRTPIKNLTSIDWDLKNESGNSIGSGVYIIHVNAGSLGEKVIKFFNIGRDLTLENY